MPDPAHRAGLEGVIVADTRLSEVDGERGRLVIAGSDVEKLAGNVSFEELAHRLWSLYLPESSPDRLQNAGARLGLGKHRVGERSDSGLHCGMGCEATGSAAHAT